MSFEVYTTGVQGALGTCWKLITFRKIASVGIPQGRTGGVVNAQRCPRSPPTQGNFLADLYAPKKGRP